MAVMIGTKRLLSERRFRNSTAPSRTAISSSEVSVDDAASVRPPTARKAAPACRLGVS